MNADERRSKQQYGEPHSRTGSGSNQGRVCCVYLRQSAVYGAFIVLLAAAVAVLFGCGKPEPPLPPLPPVEKLSQPPVAVEKPAPEKQDEAALFFPWHPGDKWEMDARSGPDTYKFELTATVEHEIDGKKTRFIEMKRDGQTVQSEGYIADDAGIHRIAFGPDGKGRIEPPMTVLKLPLKTGDEWDWKGKFKSEDGSVDGEARFKVNKLESIKSPAGTFFAFRVDQTISQITPEGRNETVNKQWFAPKNGLVKQETTTGDSTVSAELTKHTAVQQ
jgi:hypothetical protein